MTDKFQADDHNDIESQAVVYLNSKTNAEKYLLDMLTKLLEKLHKPADRETFADSLTAFPGIPVDVDFDAFLQLGLMVKNRESI